MMKNLVLILGILILCANCTQEEVMDEKKEKQVRMKGTGCLPNLYVELQSDDPFNVIITWGGIIGSPKDHDFKISYYGVGLKSGSSSGAMGEMLVRVPSNANYLLNIDVECKIHEVIEHYYYMVCGNEINQSTTPPPAGCQVNFYSYSVNYFAPYGTTITFTKNYDYIVGKLVPTSYQWFKFNTMTHKYDIKDPFKCGTISDPDHFTLTIPQCSIDNESWELRLYSNGCDKSATENYLYNQITFYGSNGYGLSWSNRMIEYKNHPW